VPPRLLWRSVLKATIDTLLGESKGQYGITLAKPEGMDDFLLGLPRSPPDDKGGFDVVIPLEPASGTPAVPATPITLTWNGSGAARREWRIPNQRPGTAYPLWRQGVGVQPTTQPGTDFIAIIRDDSNRFHARWIRASGLRSLSPSLVGKMGTGTAGVTDLIAADLGALVDQLASNSGADTSDDARPTEDKQGVFEDPAKRTAEDVGQGYRHEDEGKTTAAPAAALIDPDKRDRGNQGHSRTQNALATFLIARGIEPLSPASGDPNFDIAWIDGSTLFVAEAKSLTEENEEGQLRLGLGQVLRYAHLLRRSGLTVQAVLAAEQQPGETTWGPTCAENNVILVWPGTFDRLSVSES
jgi:hypothetical protein